tara:strand:- start:231 stop:683 length:453 start_codon:yes stop_codon:yes gene_type:complete
MASRRCTDRFWDKVDKTGDCWIWTGAKQHSGYGRFRFNGGLDGAHRVSYILSYGPIPADKMVCHSCDNPSCVNPAHLWAGTGKDNMQDAVQKGRAARGETQGSSKLTAANVLSIREIANGGTTQVKIAEQFNISSAHVSDIVLRKRWRHI